MSKYILYKDSSLDRPKQLSKSTFASASYGTEYIYDPLDNPYTFYWFSGSADFSSADYKKLKSLKNTINYYSGVDDLFNFNNFLNVTSSLICFSSNYLGSGLQKGSVALTIHCSGTMIDTATDAKENGILSSSLNGKIGIVLYKEGFILLNNTAILTASQFTFNGVNDYPRWTNFYANDVTNTAITCDIEFLGVNTVPINTVYAVANKNELNHSNNLTYLQSGSYTYSTGSSFFKENERMAIQNVVASPFISGSANFEKETFITRIGLYDKDKKVIGYASLANPVRKTENREFIFKLKIDI